VTVTGAVREPEATGTEATETTSGSAGDGGGLDLARAVGLIFTLLGFGIGSRVITDNSFLTHLATGNLILEQGAVPTADPYSSVANGEPWIVQSWLVSLVYGVLDAVFGGWAIRLFHGAIGAAVTAGLWRLTEPARQLVTRAGLVSLVVLIGTSLWSPRPLLVGLLATVLVLQVLEGIRRPWLLVPVFWVWVNSHGSFVLGCALIAATTLGAAIDDRRLPVRELRVAAFGVAGCLLAMVNPLGWRLLWFPLHLIRRGDALDRVTEWASPSFRVPVEQLFLLLLGLIVLAASRGGPWRALLPSLAFFVGGLLAVRNLGLASLVIVAMAGPSLRDLLGSLDGRAPGRVPRLVAAVAIAGSIVVVAGVVTTGPVGLDSYPTEEVTWLDERSLVAEPDVRLAQRDFVGNYLTLRYGPEAGVFMDDRFDFYPQTVIDDHNGLLLGGDFADIMARNSFDVVLWATDTPLRRWLDTDPEWQVVVGDDAWFVACRTGSPVYDRCRR